MDKIEALKGWINSGKFCSWEKNVHVSGESNNPKEGVREIKIELFTEKHVYHIVGRDRKEGRSYLGCIANNRAPLPGESHTRGSDLADGDFTFETWCNIVLDILSYELLEIPRMPKPSKIAVMEA